MADAIANDIIINDALSQTIREVNILTEIGKNINREKLIKLEKNPCQSLICDKPLFA